MDQNETKAVQTVAQDVVDAASITKQSIEAFKSKNKSDALIALLPKIVEMIQKDIGDVRVALPIIKAGWKTSEFWLTAGVILVNGIVFVVTDKGLPIDVNALLTAVVGVYTVARTWGKAQSPAPATPVDTRS